MVRWGGYDERLVERIVGCVQGPWGISRGAAWASGDPGQRKGRQ